MNKNVIIIIAVIIMISITMIMLSTSTQYQESMRPSIEDNLNPIDQSLINLDNSDAILISESTNILNNSINYTIDKDGNKQYILDVTDSPILED